MTRVRHLHCLFIFFSQQLSEREDIKRAITVVTKKKKGTKRKSLAKKKGRTKRRDYTSCFLNNIYFPMYSAITFFFLKLETSDFFIYISVFLESGFDNICDGSRDHISF